MSNTNTEVLTTAYEKLQGAITQANTVLPELQEAVEKGNLDNYATTSDLEEKASYKDNGNRVTSAFDTFNRADGKVTKSEDGQSYLTSGDNESILFTVSNKVAKLGGLGNAYMSLATTNNIETLGAEWYWNTGTTHSTIALVITNDNDLSLKNLLHFITNSTEWNLQIRKEATGMDLPVVLSGKYDTPLSLDGTKYRFEMTVKRDENTVYLRLPDGTITKYTSEDIPTVSGKRGFWQVIRRHDTDEEPCFTSIWLTENLSRTLGSSKENLNVFPAVTQLRSEMLNSNLNKKIYSFTPTTSGWHRVLTSVSDILVGEVNIYTSGQYDGTITNLTLNFASTAFSKNGIFVNQSNFSNFNGGIIEEIRVGNNGSNTHYLDIKIKSATSPKPIYFEFMGNELLKRFNDNAQNVFNVTSGATAPVNYNTLICGKGLRTTGVIRSYIQETEFEVVTTTGNCNTLISTTIIDTSGGDVTITLPNATTAKNHIHTFSKLSVNDNNAVIVGFFNDGTTTKTLDCLSPVRVISLGTTNKWILI